MRRREVLLVLTTGMIGARPLRAQQKAMPVVGFLSSASPGPYAPYVAALRQGLSETGYIEGQNVAIEYRWAEGHYDRLPGLAADLVGRKVDVIVAANDPAGQTAQMATSSIPIVIAEMADPVGSGFAVALARPGGNVTGLSTVSTELTGKRLQLLKESVPTLSRVAVLVLGDPIGPRYAQAVREAGVSALALGVQIQLFVARNAGELDTVFATMTRRSTDGALVVQTTALYDRQARLALAEHGLKHRLPIMCAGRVFVRDGCFISYFPNVTDLYRRSATYVDKILNGAKPADLPVQQPTTFELVVNLKTAKALGLTIPRALLDLANEVIE